MRNKDRCPECGSWEAECGSDLPVPSCRCARCACAEINLLKAELKSAKAEVNRLSAIVDEWNRAVDQAESLPCEDEVHCTCVPLLMGKIKDLKQELSRRTLRWHTGPVPEDGDYIWRWNPSERKMYGNGMYCCHFDSGYTDGRVEWAGPIIIEE